MGKVVRVDQSNPRSGIASASGAHTDMCHPTSAFGSLPSMYLRLKRRGDGRFDSIRRRVRRLVLPHAVNVPTRFGENTVVSAVAFDVGLQLFSPPARVGSRLSRVSRTAVPEATINEHGDPRAHEDDVSSTPYAGYRSVIDAVTQSASVELSAKRKLGPRVASTVGAHRRAAGRGGRRRRGGTGHEHIIFELGTLMPWSASARSRTVPVGCP